MYNFKGFNSAFGEEWKEVDFGEVKPQKKYLVSNFGRIVSYTDDPSFARPIKLASIGGYLSFNIRYKGKRKTFYAHRLVAEHFMQKISHEQKIVIHKDHNKSNNNINNLQWATIQEKSKHQENSPRVIEARLVKRSSNQIGHKLTSTDVIRIKKKIWDPNRKTRMKMIAKQFGISEMQLYRIRSGENWSHIRVPGEPDWTRREK